MIICESLKLLTPEEFEQAKQYHQEFAKVVDSHNETRQKYRECKDDTLRGKYRQELKESAKTLDQYQANIDKLLQKGADRLLESKSHSQIIEHAYKCLNSITFEDYSYFLARTYQPEDKVFTDFVLLSIETTTFIDVQTDIGYILNYLSSNPKFEKEFYKLQEDVESVAENLRDRLEENLPTLSDLFKNAKNNPPLTGTNTSGNEPYRLMAGVTDKFSFTVDKVNMKLWRGFQNQSESEQENQIMLQTLTAPENHPDYEDIYVLTSIKFDELEETKLSKKLTAYDKRVYNAIGTFWNRGYSVFSESQLWREIGNTGSPSKTQIKKLHDSLTKLLLTHININNLQETSHGFRYPPVSYDGSLLPFERVTAYDSKGEMCEGAIHLFREPPLYQFARERNQITTIERILLMSPISKTDGNLEIEEYLLERIARMKDDKKAQRKILYSTIFDNCNITEKKQKQRTPEKVKTYLDYYREHNYIKDHKQEKDGVIIIF